MSKHYCPNCVEPFKKDRKKLGGIVIWLVCPKCGLRTRESHLDSSATNEAIHHIERREESNRLGGYHSSDENEINSVKFVD